MVFGQRSDIHCRGELVSGCDHQTSCAVEVWEEAEDEGGRDCLEGVVDGACGVGGLDGGGHDGWFWVLLFG